jgi:hypothetical protein
MPSNPSIIPSLATSPFAARELDAGIQKIVGDKVYDSDPLRKSLRKDGITPVIPARADRNNSSEPVLVLSARGVPAHCYDKLAQKPFYSACLGRRALIDTVIEFGSSRPDESADHQKRSSIGLGISITWKC